MIVFRFLFFGQRQTKKLIRLFGYLVIVGRYSMLVIRYSFFTFRSTINVFLLRYNLQLTTYNLINIQAFFNNQAFFYYGILFFEHFLLITAPLQHKPPLIERHVLPIFLLNHFSTLEFVGRFHFVNQLLF